MISICLLSHVACVQSTPSVGQTVQLQHPPEPQPVTSPTVLEVIQQAQARQQAPPHQQPIHINPSQSLMELPGGQQTLHHVDPPPQSADAQQQQQQQTLFLPGGVQSQSATVVIQSPLLETQNQQQAGPMMLETQGGHVQYQLQHLDPSPDHQQGLQMVQQVLMHSSQNQPTSIADHFTSQQQASEQQIHDHFAAAGQQTSGEERGLEFQNIPENESISRSISPITASLQPTSEQAASFTTHHQAPQPPSAMQLSNAPATSRTGGEMLSGIPLGTLQSGLPS